MLNLSRVLFSKFWVIILLLIEFFPADVFAKNDSVRVAIVYNSSLTGQRYKDGIYDNLDSVIGNYRIKPLCIPYLKTSHGIDTIKSLILNKEADVIFGPTESDVFAGVYNTDMITDNKISIISGLATSNIGNDPQGYFFRLNMEAKERIYEIWSLLNSYWISNVAIIYENTEFGRSCEAEFKELNESLSSKNDYHSIPYNSPLIPISEIKNYIIKERPEVIGLFCEREDIQRIYATIAQINNSGVPYNPYYFSPIDISTVSKGLENIFYPSLQIYSDTVIMDSIVQDEVYILGAQTSKLFTTALTSNSNPIDFSTNDGRIRFRNRIVRLMQGQVTSKPTMNYRKMKNVGPLYLYRINANTINPIKVKQNISVLQALKIKLACIYSTNNFMLLFNLLLIFILTISISKIELRVSFPEKHVKIHKSKIFYKYIGIHLFFVLLIYIFLAETKRISYFDTIMAIIICVTPTAFVKTTFFESKSGSIIGLEGIYKRWMANIDNQIMEARYNILSKLRNTIAYSNSEESMRKALLRMYRNHPSPVVTSKRIQRMEDKLTAAKDYMARKRAAAELIIRLFDMEKLKGEAFVPPNWDENESPDPQTFIRKVAKYCAEYDEKKEHINDFAISELVKLRVRNRRKHREIKSVYKKEKSIVMSNEGDLIVKLRLILVLKNFNLQWLVEENIMSQEKLNELKSDDTPEKETEKLFQPYFGKKLS